VCLWLSCAPGLRHTSIAECVSVKNMFYIALHSACGTWNALHTSLHSASLTIHWFWVPIFRTNCDVRDDHKLSVFSPGTVKSMIERSQSRLKFISAQSWYKVRTCELVNPTFKISLLCTPWLRHDSIAERVFDMEYIPASLKWNAIYYSASLTWNTFEIAFLSASLNVMLETRSFEDMEFVKKRADTSAQGASENSARRPDDAHAFNSSCDNCRVAQKLDNFQVLSRLATEEAYTPRGNSKD